MNSVFLSPNFPPTYYNFCEALSDVGVTVLGIGEEGYDNLCLRLKRSLREYYHVNSLENYHEVRRAFEYFTDKYGRIDCVESHNEHWLSLEGRLRGDFNITGLKESEVLSYKRKSRMKELFRNAGVPVAEGILAVDMSSVERFVTEYGFPVFAKPDIGVGAASTYRIDDREQLKHFWETRPQTDYFIEEFVDGYLSTFDGITDRNGGISFFSSLFSDIGAYELIAYNEDLSFYLIRDIPQDIIDFGQRCVKAFNISGRFFHMEFLRRRSDSKLIALEMNCRPPGGYTIDLMNYASDIDVYRHWAEITAGRAVNMDNINRKYFAAHISRKDGKRYVHSHQEIMACYGDKIVLATEVPQVFSGIMGNYAYIARSEHIGEIRDMIAFIQVKSD